MHLHCYSQTCLLTCAYFLWELWFLNGVFFFWKWENKSSVAFVIYSRPGFRNLEICSEERCVANLSLEIHPYCWHLIILLFYFSVDAFHMCSPVLCDKHWGSWMQRKTPVAKVILQMDIDLCTRTVDRSTDPLQSHTGKCIKVFHIDFYFLLLKINLLYFSYICLHSSPCVRLKNKNFSP